MKFLLSNSFLLFLGFIGTFLAIYFGTVDIFKEANYEIFERWHYMVATYQLPHITFLSVYAILYLNGKDENHKISKENALVFPIAIGIIVVIFAIFYGPHSGEYPDFEILDLNPSLLGLFFFHGALSYLIVNKEGKLKISILEYTGVISLAFFIMIFSRFFAKFIF